MLCKRGGRHQISRAYRCEWAYGKAGRAGGRWAWDQTVPQAMTKRDEYDKTFEQRGMNCGITTLSGALTLPP